jgi:NADH-quinone oxidoreductase subunit F
VLSDKAKSEIRALQARYPVPRAALGPALYVAQREAGWLPPDVLAEVAALFGLDVTEVGEFASFYHQYNTHREPGQYNIEICDNVPCMLGGALKLGDLLKERLGIEFGQTTPDGRFSLGHVECLGACATAPMFMATEKATGKIRYFEELSTPEKLDAALALIASGHGFDTCERWPLGPFRHGGKPETNFLLARADKPDSHKIATYIADGGYEIAKAVVTGAVGANPQSPAVGAHPAQSPAAGANPAWSPAAGANPAWSPQRVIDEVKAANVRGRGGAGFPAGQKWSFLPAGKYPRYLVVNADESEPGTFKDRMIMEYDPHQLVEGIILTCYAIEAERAFIYVRGEYYFAAQRLEGAIAEAKAKGFLGQNIFGSGKKLEVVVHRGAGAYECGEETALLTSLEGYRGHPRLKPPFPAIEGLYARPTIVNNVETIANVPHILRRGADWYRQFGTPQSTGFRIYCLSGQVKYPGLYELPHGTTLRELIYTYGGGLTADAGALKAVIPGGLSVQLLDLSQLDTPLDYENVAKQGSSLGSAAVIVIGANQSLVEVARRTLAFYREESCGKCTPCREGTPWLEAILERIERGEGRVEDIALMNYIADMIGGKSFCPFGYAAVWGLQSNLAKFRGEFDAAIAASHGQPIIPIRPIYRPDAGAPSGVSSPSLPLEEKYNAPTVKR